MQVATPCRSSWGANGYSEVWLNPTNDYVHRHLHKAGDRMVELAHLFLIQITNCKRELLINVHVNYY